MSASIPTRPKVLPKNFPAVPPAYSDALFRLQVQAARRYLFDTELKELLEQCGLPLEIADPAGPAIALTVADCSAFMQGLKQLAGEDKALPFGRDAFNSCTSIIVRSGNLPPVLRAVSSSSERRLSLRAGS